MPVGHSLNIRFVLRTMRLCSFPRGASKEGGVGTGRATPGSYPVNAPIERDLIVSKVRIGAPSNVICHSSRIPGSRARFRGARHDFPPKNPMPRQLFPLILSRHAALLPVGVGLLLLAMPSVVWAQAAAGAQPGQGQTRPAAAPAPVQQEKIGDWQLVCVAAEKDKRCSLLQALNDAKSGQRLLALELAVKGDHLEGAAVLPFGIALARGLTVRVKEGEPGTTVGFQTCLPAGCLAPISLDAATVKQLDQTRALLLSVGLPTGETANFTLPVTGIVKAEARLRAVGGSGG